MPTAGPTATENPLLVSETAAAVYTGRALDGLREAGCTGALLWCFTEYSPTLNASPRSTSPEASAVLLEGAHVGGQ